jgi:NhaC family Na+:H+ antiporter
MNSTKSPTLLQALLPVILLIILLSLNVIVFKQNTLHGANQIVLLLSAAVAGLISMRLNVDWDKLLNAINKSISIAMPSVLILLIIGSLAGTWLISGIIPVMIYYGLQIIHPSVFLLTAVVVSGIISLITGSSWSTIATIGIALLGIGKTLGINEGLVAGAIISGAYFGDKMSPLSDTTNLAPAVAGTDLFTHVRYMTITTVPSILLALIIFMIIGFANNYSSAETNMESVLMVIDRSFNLSPFLLLVPAILIFIIVKKVPALPSLLIATLVGAIAALIFQPELIRQLAGEGTGQLKASYIVVMRAMFGDIQIDTGHKVINDLLTSEGMAGMLYTVWLIISAMAFGGVMEAGGLLRRITMAVISFAHSTGSLIAATLTTCIFFNITASDQYLSIVVPGRMFSQTFRDKGLKPEVLSRTLEDAGTLTSVLVPWNTCGATQARVLNVPTLTYLPFCFFNLINPVIALIIGYANFKIRRINEAEPATLISAAHNQ